MTKSLEREKKRDTTPTTCCAAKASRDGEREGNVRSNGTSPEKWKGQVSKIKRKAKEMVSCQLVRQILFIGLHE